MKFKLSLISILSLMILVAGRADTITTKEGATIVGNITKIEDGKVIISTTFAGTITVDQKQVLTLKIDDPLNVRLADHSLLIGSVETNENGNAEIKTGTQSYTTPIPEISTTWAKGSIDPEIAALTRKWRYEVAADLTGKSGNSHEFGSALSARATLAGPTDIFLLYANYDRQKSDGSVTTNQFKGGMDYQHDFSEHFSWYVRDEAGFDKIKGIDFYNIAAAGIGYYFIKKPKHTLIGRVGLSYRYEGYEDVTKDDLSSLGLDLSLSHTWIFDNSKLVNNLTYTPAFESIHEYRVFHESYYELPLSASLWKLRLGISNDFNNRPGPDKKRMDTTYFARLVLTWD